MARPAGLLSREEALALERSLSERVASTEHLPRRQLGGHLHRDVRVARLAVHGPRRAAHVHQDHAGAAARHEAGHRRIAGQRRDVVHDLRPRGRRARLSGQNRVPDPPAITTA